MAARPDAPRDHARRGGEGLRQGHRGGRRLAGGRVAADLLRALQGRGGLLRRRLRRGNSEILARWHWPCGQQPCGLARAVRGGDRGLRRALASDPHMARACLVDVQEPGRGRSRCAASSTSGSSPRCEPALGTGSGRARSPRSRSRRPWPIVASRADSIAVRGAGLDARAPVTVPSLHAAERVRTSRYASAPPQIVGTTVDLDVAAHARSIDGDHGSLAILEQRAQVDVPAACCSSSTESCLDPSPRPATPTLTCRGTPAPRRCRPGSCRRPNRASTSRTAPAPSISRTCDEAVRARSSGARGPGPTLQAPACRRRCRRRHRAPAWCASWARAVMRHCRPAPQRSSARLPLREASRPRRPPAGRATVACAVAVDRRAATP